MPEVLINNESITLFGPPEQVAVSTDFGAKGDPGSQIYVGIGDPNEVAIGVEPVLNDLYINASPDENYSFLYQYISEPGGNVWTKILKISPAIFSKKYTVSFTSGTASIQIPASEIVLPIPTGITVSNFNVQASIINSNPVAHSVSSLSYATNTLTINLNAAEYSSSTWSALSGSKTVDIFVSITQ